MLVAASVCPHPPLLVPVVSVAEPPWLRDLRSACHASVARVLGTGPDLVAVVGAGTPARSWDRSAGGTLAAFGVDVRAGGAELCLPLAQTVGAWLLDQAGWGGPRRYVALAGDTGSDDCLRAGETAAEAADRVAMLVMGDGSAKRSTRAPGYLDDRSTAYDADVASALAAGDVSALEKLDAALAEQLWVAGRPAWQALAGAARRGVRPVAASLAYDDAPLGVGYFVADWTM